MKEIKKTNNIVNLVKKYIKAVLKGTIYPVVNYYYTLKKNPKLKELIKDQRILILGSGPSANDLDTIPKDIKLFACNASPKVLIDKEINKKIDLYLGYKINLINDVYKDKDIFKLLSKNNPSFFVTENLRWTKKQISLREINTTLIQDDKDNNHYLNQLIKPLKIDHIIGDSKRKTSSGIRLLQYTLYFKAKEIYLIGIDATLEYAWGEKSRRTNHNEIDVNFMKLMSKKYKNIYSASKNSPINEYIKYKPLI